MRRFWLIQCLLAVITATAFWDVHTLGFIAYDDPDYITTNWLVQRGLTREGLAWAFGQVHGTETYWHPITWVTHMFDCQFFGLNGGAHHLTSLAFHIANVLLLFLLIFRTTGAFWTSAVVAALFGVHPLQVESVAWITERKNLVSTLFALLTLLAYVKYTQQRSKRWYWAAIGAFILALMSKPAVVTIPCVMLLMDVWPLRRAALFNTAGRFAPSQLLQSKLLFLEKIPFLALSVGSGILTITAHLDLGTLNPEAAPPVSLNYGNIVVSYVEYIRKFLWPVDLAVFYPFRTTLTFQDVAASLAIIALITVAVLLQLRRRSFLAVGWFWFVGVMLPMTGVVQVGTQAMADRFMYVPIIGLLIMVCLTAREALAYSVYRIPVAAVGTVLVLGTCMVFSRIQLSYWKNDLTLFEHARHVTKDNYLAYNVVGHMLLREGAVDAAMTSFQAALAIQPAFADPHVSIGSLNLSKGRLQEAAKEFEEALRTRPRYYEARLGLAVTYQRLGNIDAAITNYEETVRLKPDLAAAHRGLADLLLAKGRFRDALAQYREVIKFEPNSAEVLGRTSWLLATHNDPQVRNGPAAVQFGEKACQLTGYAQPQPLNALAAAYAEVGKFDLAVSTEQKALDIARARNQANLIPMTETLLKLYQSGKPYREGQE